MKSLLAAIKENDIAIVKKLISQGVDVNRGDGDLTPLIASILYNRNTIFLLLLDIGANVEKRDGRGYEPIRYTATNNRPEMARKLLTRGASVDSLNEFRITPLMDACGYGFINVVKILVAYRADINHQDIDGNTPLIQVAYFGKTDCVRFLVSNGANVDMQTKKGEKASDIAMQRGHRGISGMLRSLEKS